MSSPTEPYLTYEFTPAGNPALQRRLRRLMVACLIGFLAFMSCAGALIIGYMNVLPLFRPQPWLAATITVLTLALLGGTSRLLYLSERTRRQLAAIINEQINAELARWRRDGADRWLVLRDIWIGSALNLWLAHPDGTPLDFRLRIENADDDLIVRTGIGRRSTVRFGRMWHVRYGDALEWMWRPRPVRICFLGPLILHRPLPTAT